MNKKLRVLIVGCGYFGKKRIQACLQLKQRVLLVGVVDKNETLAKKTGQALHVPYATSIKKILQYTSADFAIIAIPNSFHAPVVCEAIKNNLHVLCEKPLATTVSGAKKIIAASKKYGKFVKTGSNHRFFPTIQKAHEIIQRGEIGKILYIKGDIGTNGSHTKQSWFWNKKFSGGGTYIDNACHLLDITRWFMGDFASVVGTTSTIYWKQTDAEDVAGGIYKTKNGKIAIITSSWAQWTGYVSLEIWGDKGYVLIDSKRGDTVTVGTQKADKQKTYDFSKKPLSSYTDELTYFITCIQKNIPPRPNAEDGGKVIQMIEGLYTSTKLKKSVGLSQKI